MNGNGGGGKDGDDREPVTQLGDTKLKPLQISYLDPNLNKPTIKRHCSDNQETRIQTKC